MEGLSTNSCQLSLVQDGNTKGLIKKYLEKKNVYNVQSNIYIYISIFLMALQHFGEQNATIVWVYIYPTVAFCSLKC